MFAARPILFFDSGIGGLSVLREARLLLPEYRFLYMMDNAGFPYGAWEEEALTARIVKLFGAWLRRYNPALCVLACNTASTLALPALRAAFPGCAFVGTVPAVKPAAGFSASQLISVLATPGTVRRGYTRDLIAKYAGKCRVNLVGAACLASQAEAYMRGKPVDREVIKAEIAPCFVQANGKRTDIIVLACTHYPFLIPLLRSLAPWPVDWLDPAEAIARRAYALLEEKKAGETGAAAGAKPPRGDYALCTDWSGGADFITERLFQTFGLKLKKTA